jgi:hypothetical protein
VQASVAVFGPQAGPGSEAAAGLWQIPIGASGVQILTAPDLLPRLPLLVAFALAAMLTAHRLRRLPDAQLLAPKQ